MITCIILCRLGLLRSHEGAKGRTCLVIRSRFDKASALAVELEPSQNGVSPPR
jgi:hypothetical protein